MIIRILRALPAPTKGLGPLGTICLALCLMAAPVRAEDGYGLIFVYRTDCAASGALSRSLKAVADRYAMAVLPVSLDGARFAEWPGTIPDRGQAHGLGIARVPFLALYDARTATLTPIAAGHLPPAQLEARIAATLKASP
ncbi:MAG: hypothetical protein GKS00_01860 [Alphaproteobacteria bacterium]|nr:hypothetical protein [Alphaproteobacteria bacterium]